LIRKYPDKADINSRDRRGFTALHSAVVVEDQLDEIILKLLHFENVDCNVQNQDDNTPLHYFCERSTSHNCRYIGMYFSNKN
jgi:ankyrin repeat protein